MPTMEEVNVVEEVNVIEAGENKEEVKVIGSLRGSMHLEYGKLDSELSQALKKFDKRQTGTVNLGDLHAAADAMTKQGEMNRLLRSIIFMLVAVIFIQAWATFGMSFWASSLVKDTNAVDSGGGVALTGTGSNAIMQVLPATESGIALHHALVLDMEHLRTMDEISYRIGNTTDRTEKVVAVDRYQGTKGSDVEVTIFTVLQNKIVLSPAGVALVDVQGRSTPMCGEMRCANFKVDDPELDSTILEEKLAKVLDEHESRRLAEGRRLGRCESPRRRTRGRR